MEQAENGMRITIEGVRHIYNNDTVALDGIDLNLGIGLFGLLGPNGAGKSTLMRIICTLLPPTEGKVSVGGYDVMHNRREVRGLIGYLPQEFSAWRLHRVAEVLDTLAALSGLEEKSVRHKRVDEVIESVGLSDVADRKVKKLSGGMVRRLGVAQALVHEPKILIVDEPTVGLDPEERIHFRQLMARLGQERIIILSTHIVADLGAGCHDLALIDHGKVKFRGSPEELINRARGIVFKVSMLRSNEPEFTKALEVISREDTEKMVIIKAVSRDGRLPEGAEPIKDPSLEEAYVAFMAVEGKKHAASEKELA